MKYWIILNFALVLMIISSSCTQSKKEEVDQTVWVKATTKETSCETDGKQFEENLKKAGIQVIKSEVKSDGQMHAEMCGTDTGNETHFQIQKSDLERAKNTGFTPAKP